MNSKYSIGIDLGTTNSVLAYARLDEEDPNVELLPLPQVVAAHTVEDRAALPSFLYLPTSEESAGGNYNLPWSENPGHMAGEWARKQSADVPTRTVAAAKSCSSGSARS